MLSAVGTFLLGLLFLLLGGDSVQRGVSGLAQRLGLKPFRAGLLLATFATSIPELVINAQAVAVGDSDLALGNAVGSNIVNIGLTLAMAAIAAPLLVSMRLVSAKLVLILVASGAVMFFGLDGSLSRNEGALLMAGFVGFLVLMWARGGDESAEVKKELAEAAVTHTHLVQNLFRLAMAGAFLYFGARWVVASAPEIGRALGFDSLVSGLLIVAIGTAVPEMVAAVLSARRGHGNIVAGQALGACLFNLLFVVGGMALLHPVPVPLSFVEFEVPAAMAFTLALYPMLGGDLRLERREGGMLLGLFALWVGYELCLAWF